MESTDYKKFLHCPRNYIKYKLNMFLEPLKQRLKEVKLAITKEKG